MRMICAWCRTVMEPGAGPDDPKTSHGMCSSCERLTDAERDQLAERWARTRTLYESLTCGDCGKIHDSEVAAEACCTMQGLTDEDLAGVVCEECDEPLDAHHPDCSLNPVYDRDRRTDEYDEAYERAAARARSNDFEETGGKDWT